MSEVIDRPDICWVLWWRYHDNSSQGVSRAYIEEGRAQADIQLLTESDPTRDWHLEEIPVYY